MAGGTIRSKLTVVRVPGRVAGIAIPGRALIHIINVTRFTVQIGVCASQRERRIVMIECGVLPAAGVMASRTDRSKLTAVRVPGRVAGVAILWCACMYIIHVAGLTRDVRVQAIKRKRRVVVIESHI